MTGLLERAEEELRRAERGGAYLDQLGRQRRARGNGKGGRAEATAGGKQATEPAPTVITAAVLWDMRHAPTRWAVPGILPEGVCILAGKPKAGKSWLALDLALAVGAGGLALNKIPVDRGPVLFLALEDTARRLTKRLRILCHKTPPSCVEFMTASPRLGMGGEDFLRASLAVEGELRAPSGDKPSIRGWVEACLSRGGLAYEDIEAVKERLGGDFLRTRAVDSGAYCRDLRKYIVGGSLKEPPAADRIAKMYFSQRDGAVAELGGEPRMLFTLVAIVAEQVYQERPELFGGIDDIDAHKAKLAELEGKRAELYAKFPSTWAHGDLHIGRITSDGAALITFAKAAGEVPVHPPESAGERLVDFLLKKESEADTAKAA